MFACFAQIATALLALGWLHSPHDLPTYPRWWVDQHPTLQPPIHLLLLLWPCP